MYVAILFLGATNAATVQPTIAIERTVFYREKAAGMYSAIPYAISQVAVEIMYSMIQTGVSHADPLLNDWIRLDWGKILMVLLLNANKLDIYHAVWYNACDLNTKLLDCWEPHVLP
ncbi:hypothetical protein Bca4012_027213 [Brassica carinata]